MHGRTFLDRKIFITSIVAASPKKAAHLSLDSVTGQPGGEATSSGAGAAGGTPAASLASGPPKTPPPGAKLNPTDSIDDSSKNLISPGIQEKVDAFSLKNDKRKSEFSPDQTAANKEKKRLKEQEKSAKKKEEWKKKQVVISPQHNGH